MEGRWLDTELNNMQKYLQKICKNINILGAQIQMKHMQKSKNFTTEGKNIISNLSVEGKNIISYPSVEVKNIISSPSV